MDDLIELFLKILDPLVRLLGPHAFAAFTVFGVVVTSILQKKKAKRQKERDNRVERKIDFIMEAVGAQWVASGSTTFSQVSATKSKSPYISRLGGFITALIAVLITKFRIGGIHMKDYLRKLGSRKFQAFLAVTIPNLIIMFGFIFGGIDLEGDVNEWMPAINLVIQAITTAIYQGAEAGVDKANALGGQRNDDIHIPTDDRI
ncbi:hypothetical protein MO973_19525 [Paenibacillus sp. TRM 82003]|nr:hypothetical protein [Paenibacillus sp. TRM 82003]